MTNREITTTVFYEKFEEERKEATRLRHQQANTYNKILLSMENKMEAWFEEVKSIMAYNHKEIKETYATKHEVGVIKNSNDRVWKIIWAVIGFVFVWLWATMGTVMVYFIKQT
jgi:hypothetical protein